MFGLFNNSNEARVVKADDELGWSWRDKVGVRG